MVFLALSPTMAGIENRSQHCFANSLIQTLLVHEPLYQTLTDHTVGHVEPLGKDIKQ